VTSPLERLAAGKSLAKEPPDAEEFAGLRKSGLARIADAANASVSLEGRFDLAYNAAHALALAALRYHGYRPANRYIVFQALPHTLASARKSGGSLPKGTKSAILASTKGS
jgi:hypothetical protein